MKRQKTEFGEFLVEEIRKIGLFQQDFYTATEIQKPYFYDLLTKTPPPPELQDKMLSVLEENSYEDKERRYKFYDLASKERNELPKDIVDFLKKNPKAIKKIRESMGR